MTARAAKLLAMISAAAPAQSGTTVRTETQIELARWTVGAGLVVGVFVSMALAYAIWWLYRHERRGRMTPASRWGLTLLRCAVLAVLGLIGLEPVLARYVHRTVAATTFVLVDDSISMEVADRYESPARLSKLSELAPAAPAADSPTRLALAEALLNQAGGRWLKALAGQNQLRVMRFSDQAAPLLQSTGAGGPQAGDGSVETSATVDPAASAPSIDRGLPVRLTGGGRGTDLGRAIREAVRSASGAPIAGVVVVSDGAVNLGDAPEAIAGFARMQRVPLFTVGVGDPAEPENRRIVEIRTPRQAFTRDPFDVTVQVADEGSASPSPKARNDEDGLGVELLIRRPEEDPASARVLAERRATRDAGGAFAPLKIPCRVDQPGSYVLTARVAAGPREAVAGDNMRDASPPLTVLDRRMRVLLIAGAPTFDYRYVTRAFQRDETIDVSCWLQSADARAARDGDTLIERLPAGRAELLKYDAILMLDPDPEGFEPTWAGDVAAFVTEFGGGLLYQADTKWTRYFFRNNNARAVAELLPIVPDPEADLTLNQLGRYQKKSWPILIPPDEAASPLLRQGDDPAATLAAWSMLDGVYWHYPVKREKPTATVLMRHGNPAMTGATGPQVLYAAQYAGAGRTAFLGFNSTWRWRRYGEELFERFWVQAVRGITEGRFMAGSQRGVLTTDRDRFDRGDTVVITLRATNEQFEPLIADGVDLSVMLAGSPVGQVRLSPTPGRDGYFQGHWTADRTGVVRLTAALPSTESTPAVVVRDLLIETPDLELRQPRMRPDVLERLATETGGKYVAIESAGELPSLIPDRSESFVTRERPVPLWDRAWLLSALVGLLTVEWIWRKRARLL